MGSDFHIEKAHQMTPSVSIIIPCYNHAHFLANAVQSVMAQTYANWEIIIVDDGSSDNTAEAAAAFNDPRIHYTYQENKGLSGARNTGIRAAQGEYLAFLDADDEWCPDFLERCLTMLEAINDARIVGVYTSHVHIDETGQVLPQRGSSVIAPEDLPDRLIAGNFFPVHAVIISAAVVREVGLFDEELRATEDKDLWFRITRHYTLQGIPEPLARYRVYPGSMSTNAADMHANRMTVLQKHFGPDDSNPKQWSAQKQLAYSRGYRVSALGYFSQEDNQIGWDLLMQGACISPKLLSDIKTYYEIACIMQPRGYRGNKINGPDLHNIGERILNALRKRLDKADEPLRSFYPMARGSAYLAMAQLADKSGDWQLARQYMWRSFITYPKIMLSANHMRRAIKLIMGQKIAAKLRSLKSQHA